MFLWFFFSSKKCKILKTFWNMCFQMTNVWIKKMKSTNSECGSHPACMILTWCQVNLVHILFEYFMDQYHSVIWIVTQTLLISGVYYNIYIIPIMLKTEQIIHFHDTTLTVLLKLCLSDYFPLNQSHIQVLTQFSKLLHFKR